MQAGNAFTAFLNVGNTALVLGAAAAYGGGINFGVDPIATAGQALFTIAVAYFVIRRD